MKNELNYNTHDSFVEDQNDDTWVRNVTPGVAYCKDDKSVHYNWFPRCNMEIEIGEPGSSVATSSAITSLSWNIDYSTFINAFSGQNGDSLVIVWSDDIKGVRCSGHSCDYQDDDIQIGSWGNGYYKCQCRFAESDDPEDYLYLTIPQGTTGTFYCWINSAE